MPNECSAVVWVAGRKDHVDEFIRITKAYYNYSDFKNEKSMEFSHTPHLFRIFYSEIMDYEQEGLFVCASLDIWCAWSVSSCMLEDGYYTTLKKHCEEGGIPFYGTHLVECAKKLNISIEAISEEPGMGFMEHYLINQNGDFVIYECVDMHECYIGKYNTLAEYKQANPDSEIDITTEEEYKAAKAEGAWYRVGGIPYDFEIGVNPPEPTKVMCTIVDKGDDSCA